MGGSPVSLPTTTPELITALHVLGRSWPDDAEVAPVLEAARSSTDSRVQAAVRGVVREGESSEGRRSPSRSDSRSDSRFSSRSGSWSQEGDA